MGALTSKPYAFTARPWELRSREAVDYFDSFGSSIRIDLRGLDIMRVLPRINETLNEEWITDKVRFFYDGLKRQRLVAPLRRIGSRFIKINWIEVYAELAKHLLLSGARRINLFVGKLVDLNCFYSFVIFFNRLKQLNKTTVAVLYSEDPYSSLPRFFRKQYMFPALEQLQKVDLLLLIGSNLRLESPLLNVQVRKRVLTYNLSVFTLGFQSDLTYETTNLGLLATSVKSLVEGRHPFLKFWLRRSFPMVLYSYGVSRLRLNNSLELFKRLASCFGPLNLNFLGLSGSSSAVFDYGVLNSFIDKKVTSNFSLSWVLNNDEICFDSNDYTVYSGHHGDRNALLGNLVLPIAATLEKGTAYLNMNGLYQESDFLLSPPVSVRSDFHFVNSFFFFARALLVSSYVVFSQISYLSLRHYVMRFLGYAFSPLNRDTSFPIEPLLGLSYSLPPNFKSLNVPIAYLLESYYLDNQITRASHVMALAQTRFKRYLTNFK